MDEALTLSDAAERVGVSPATLRRWARTGVVPGVEANGGWNSAAVAHARIVARLRERGHPLDQIRAAGEQGRLAYGYIEELFSTEEPHRSLDEVADDTGLEPALIERFWGGVGLPTAGLDQLTDEDTQALRYVASILDAGFPLVAFLQLTRVYGQALAEIADAEVRLFHLYVHEPLMRKGVPGLDIADEMEGLAGDLLPLTSPLMAYLHQRFLRQFTEQDVVGHMESGLEDEEIALGRVRVAVAFADLAGYARFTEEEGDEQALSLVERFMEGVTDTLPDDARVIKTIGDEVMVVGSDIRALVDWAVGFVGLFAERPEPRIGVHWGTSIYRDGDYYGREINLASRVVARARGGEVLVSDAVTGAVEGAAHLSFEPIGQVKLKGFDEPRRLYRAASRG